MKGAATNRAFCYIVTFIARVSLRHRASSPNGRTQQATERNHARLVGTKNEPHADSTINRFEMGSTGPLWCSWGNAFGVQFEIQAAGQRFESLR